MLNSFSGRGSSPKSIDLVGAMNQVASSFLLNALSGVLGRLNSRRAVLDLQRLRTRGIRSVGEHTYGTPTIYISHPDDRVTIGKFCSIAPGVSLVPGGIHPMTGVSTYPFLKRLGYEDVDSSVTRRGPIEVGHDVWIGTRALVLSGATVGNGAIVAAGATVVRDVPPYAIVAGTPARVIRYRLTQNEIDRLQGSRWWDYSDDILERNLDKLVGQDIEAFVKALPVNREADLG